MNLRGGSDEKVADIHHATRLFAGESHRSPGSEGWPLGLVGQGYQQRQLRGQWNGYCAGRVLHRSGRRAQVRRW